MHNRRAGKNYHSRETGARSFRHVLSPHRISSQRRGKYGPIMAPQSTAVGFLPEHDTFGSDISYNTSRRVKSEEYSDVTIPQSRYSKYEVDSDLKEYDATSHRSPQESIIQWFDRTVENELEKRKDASFEIHNNALKSSAFSLKCPEERSYIVWPTASSGQVQLGSQIHSQPFSKLSEAVDKFAKAEALCHFTGAIEAAEEAAAKAPPECAEEAAAAGARIYQAEVKDVIHHIVGGIKPIEVVGYIGITKPKKNKKF